jgi:hypothetical protein
MVCLMSPLLRLLLVLSFAVPALMPALAEAQADSTDAPPLVEPSEEQRDLNDDAVRALTDGDYARAITLLEEALYLGELNVTFLNLGRAYQLLGRCERARAAFEKSLTAPRAEQPPPGLVEKKTREYMAELDAGCAPAAEPPDAPGPASQLSPHPDDQPRVASSPRTYALATTITAGVLLAGAGTLHLVARSQRATVTGADTDSDGYVTGLTERRAHELEARANTLDTVALSAAIAGGAMGLFGGYLWLRDPESTSRVAVSPGPKGATLTWRIEF